MSFPKKISVDISKEIHNKQELFTVVMYKGKVKAKACSPNMKQALIKAVDAFETVFTSHLEKGLLWLV